MLDRHFIFLRFKLCFNNPATGEFRFVDRTEAAALPFDLVSFLAVNYEDVRSVFIDAQDGRDALAKLLAVGGAEKAADWTIAARCPVNLKHCVPPFAVAWRSRFPSAEESDEFIVSQEWTERSEKDYQAFLAKALNASDAVGMGRPRFHVLNQIGLKLGYTKRAESA